MKYIIVIAIVALIAGGAVLLMRDRQASKVEDSSVATEAPTSPIDSSSPTNSPDASSTALSGTYIEYSSATISSTKGTKILFFYAPWCPQCRALEASIKSGQIPAGVTIIKVDYDSNQALRQKYGVTIQTTLVRVDDSGALVKKFVAYDEPTLASVKGNLL